MAISRKELLAMAKANDYKPENLEKVQCLLSTLEQFISVPYLRNRLVLKGGTALNLFHFDTIPRLSVDIDLNYIGQLDRVEMLRERPIINDAIQQVLLQKRFELLRNPGHHAGGKMVWRYPSVLGQMGNLEVDINYMYRQPLWPVQWLPSKLDANTSVKFPVLDIHELAAGKLAALFSRKASRDLFDAHFLLTRCNMEQTKLRLAWMVYLSMTTVDLEKLNTERLSYDVTDIHNKLLPVLRQKELPRAPAKIKLWANTLLTELQDALAQILPLAPHELEFVQQIRSAGKIKAELLTSDKRLAGIIATHPAIHWVIHCLDK